MRKEWTKLEAMYILLELPLCVLGRECDLMIDDNSLDTSCQKRPDYVSAIMYFILAAIRDHMQDIKSKDVEKENCKTS